MVHLRKDLNSCWTPCFWHNNVRDGSLAVAIYTFFMSLAVVTYCVYIMTGGDTSQLWLPFFETDLKNTLQGTSCPFSSIMFHIPVWATDGKRDSFNSQLIRCTFTF